MKAAFGLRSSGVDLSRFFCSAGIKCLLFLAGLE